MTRPMILHPRVVAGSGGGPDKTVLNSPRFLRPRGYDSVCLYLRPPGDEGFEPLRRRAEEWDARIEEVDDRGPTDYRIVKKCLEVCRSLNVAVWHGHDYKTNLLGLLLRRWHPMKLVTTVHGWVLHTWTTPLYYKLDRWSIKRYDGVVCVSPDLLDTCRAFGVREDRSLLIENAIDTEQFRRERSQAEAKRSLGLPEDRPLVGAVGRLSAEKGFDLLIRSFAALPQAAPRPMLIIIGEGEERPRLQEAIRSLGLENHVRLVGFQSNTRDWYEAMDLFALSSYREGLPNVVLEAMALEVPVVATRVAGVPRLLEDKHSGLIVPIGDELEMTVALSQLLRDPIRRSDYAKAGRKVIEDRYSFAVRMDNMAEVYASLGVEPAHNPTND